MSQSRPGHLHREKSLLRGDDAWVPGEAGDSTQGWASAVSRKPSICSLRPSSQLKTSSVLRPGSHPDPHGTFYYGT